MSERKLPIMIFVAACAVILSLLLVLALWPATAASTVTFSVGDDDFEFRCEVADSSSERALGLMHRESLPADEGMLFVYEEPQNLTFWMKNTLVPLDIIFVDAGSHVLNICQAEPEPGVPDSELTMYRSSGPAKWAVELNRGTCEEKGIIPGTIVSILINQN